MLDRWTDGHMDFINIKIYIKYVNQLCKYGFKQNSVYNDPNLDMLLNWEHLYALRDIYV